MVQKTSPMFLDNTWYWVVYKVHNGRNLTTRHQEKQFPRWMMVENIFDSSDESTDNSK